VAELAWILELIPNFEYKDLSHAPLVQLRQAVPVCAAKGRDRAVDGPQQGRYGGTN